LTIYCVKKKKKGAQKIHNVIHQIIMFPVLDLIKDKSYQYASSPEHPEKEVWIREHNIYFFNRLATVFFTVATFFVALFLATAIFFPAFFLSCSAAIFAFFSIF